MSYHLKGLGDALTGKNEILPFFDAKILDFIVQTECGVILGEYDHFDNQVLDRGIKIKPGMMQAKGYFAISDASVIINFVMPRSETQYARIFAEIDLSSNPHNFSIKATSQLNSPNIALEQDDITNDVTGVYQMPLYLVQLNTNNTIVVTDQRTTISKVGTVAHADRATLADNATLAANATMATKCNGVVKRYTNVWSPIVENANGEFATNERVVQTRQLISRGVLIEGTNTSGTFTDILELDYTPKYYEIKFTFQGIADGTSTQCQGSTMIQATTLTKTTLEVILPLQWNNEPSNVPQVAKAKFYINRTENASSHIGEYSVSQLKVAFNLLGTTYRNLASTETFTINSIHAIY